MDGYFIILDNVRDMNADELRGIIIGAVCTFNAFQEMKELDTEALIDILNSGNQNRRNNYSDYQSVYSSRSKQDT